MIWIALVLAVFVALAGLFATRLSRTTRVAEVSPMKQALERRIREGAEFRL